MSANRTVTCLRSASTEPPSANKSDQKHKDYAAIGTVSNIASRLCDEAKPGQILISARVLTKVENAVKVEQVGEFELKGIMRPMAAYNVVGLGSSARE
jgi:class 3 adenylate cyclase